MVYWRKIVPCRVEWNDTNIPRQAYRVAGAAPLIWLLPGFFILYYEIQPLAASGHFFDTFTRLPLIAAGIPSRTDLQLVFATEDWMDTTDK